MTRHHSRKTLLTHVLVATAAFTLTAGDSPKDFTPDDFDVPIYEIKNGYAVIEAENLPHSSLWVLRTDAPGTNHGCGPQLNDSYTGTGYLRYVGPDLMCAVQGMPEGGNHADITQGCQGKKEHWLVMKVYVRVAGLYSFRPRVYHLREDGDNDFWAHPIGQAGTITRETDCNTNVYTWPTWGPHRFNLVQGSNALYIGGRSHGIGIDRIAIYTAEGALTRYCPCRSVRSGITYL